MTRFFGGLLMAIGGLIAGLSGLCTGGFLIVGLLSVGRTFGRVHGGDATMLAASALQVLAIGIGVGVIPIGIGLGLFFTGRTMFRQAGPGA